MSLGPLVDVDTLVAAVDLDVNRILYWGSDTAIELVVADADQPTGWRVVLDISQSYDRIDSDEEAGPDGEILIFQIANIAGTSALEDAIRTATHVHIVLQAQGIDYYAPKSGSTRPREHEAQVYTIRCNVRKLNKTFFQQGAR